MPLMKRLENPNRIGRRKPALWGQALVKLTPYNRREVDLQVNGIDAETVGDFIFVWEIRIKRRSSPAVVSADAKLVCVYVKNDVL